MTSKLKIIRELDGAVFEVWKYIFSENEHHVWCHDWEGHHRIGFDCDWFN